MSEVEGLDLGVFNAGDADTMTIATDKPRDGDAAPTYEPRGPLSEQLMAALAETPETGEGMLASLVPAVERALESTRDVIRDEDIQLALFVLYSVHYGGKGSADPAWEWNPVTIAARVAIEKVFERELRLRVPVAALPPATAHSVAAALFELAREDSGPSLSQYVARTANRDQVVEFLIQKSIYTLKEADPHSWAIPRITGRAKVALVEIQADEYGGGRAERMHSEIFAGTMRLLGLDAAYGTYVDNVPALTLASFNMMSMFGLNRRLLGAIAGHLAAFEMTSSVPNRFYGNGFRRLGFGPDATWYFDEHVEADAVHEQIACRDLAGSLAEDEPKLLDDIMFGATACLVVDGWVADHIRAAWASGKSSLRRPVPAGDPGAS
jgi:hypothetical protein